MVHFYLVLGAELMVGWCSFFTMQGGTCIVSTEMLLLGLLLNEISFASTYPRFERIDSIFKYFNIFQQKINDCQNLNCKNPINPTFIQIYL